jgi:type II secretory pathway component GspD/PulD (secretin)
LIVVFPWLFFASVALAAGAGMETRIFKVKSADVQALCGVIEGVKSSEGKVAFDKNTNTIILVDYPASIETVASVINELDVAGEQVEIKVLVIDAEDGFFRDAGIVAGSPVIPQVRFSAFIAAAQASTRAHMRSQMMVRTLSGSGALLAVSRDEIFGETTTYFSDGTAITSPQRQALGDFLEVVPTAHADGTITVLLRPSVSSVTTQGLPQERSMITQVNVHSGDTVALGGLEGAATNSVSENSFGFPRAGNASTKRKVMMFLTATLMRS